MSIPLYRIFRWFFILCWPVGALAQVPARLTASRTVLTDAARADLSEIGTLLLTPRGDLWLTQYRDGVVRRINGTGTVSVLGRPGDGPGEFRMPTIAGTVGDTVWIGDVKLRRTAFFRTDGTLLRTIPYPDPARAASEGVHWEAMLPLAYLQGGAVLADGLFDTGAPRPSWATPLQWHGSAIVRLANNGAFQRVVAWLPASMCSDNVAVPGGDVIVRIPFCSGVPRHLDVEGRRIALALPGSRAGSAHIVVLGSNGDTLLSRTLNLPVVSIPAALRDSARAESASSSGARGPAFDRVMARIPLKYPAVSRILNGRDDTTWIEVASTSTGREWQMLDARGTVAGRVAIPQGTRILMAERGRLWGSEEDDDGAIRLVSFRVQ